MYSRIWQRINRFQTVVMVIITTQRFDTTRQSHTRNDTHTHIYINAIEPVRS